MYVARSALLAWVCWGLLVPHITSLRMTHAQQEGDSCDQAALGHTGASAAKLARAYDKMIGVQQIDARYSFQPKQHYVLEGAQRLLDAGFTSFKFRLQPEHKNGDKVDLNTTPMTLLEILTDTHSDFPYLKVLDMPFKTFSIDITSWGPNRNLAEVEIDWYQQVGDLVSYLITRYEGAGKTFYLGGHKGDYQIRSWAGVDVNSAQPEPTAAAEIDVNRQEMFAKMWWEQQAAVEDTRADMENHLRGVKVYSYIEVNLMKSDLVDYTVIDDIVLGMDPAPDFISVSLSDMTDYIRSSDQITALLDHVSSQLMDHPGLSGPRVFVGDLVYPLMTADGEPDALTSTQDLQAQRTLAAAAAALAWGTPAVFTHSLYDHTVTTTSSTAGRALGAAADVVGSYRGRGVGLVDVSNKESVLYQALKAYLKGAEEWLLEQIKAKGGSLPCRDDFRQWAVDKLIQLANDIPTGHDEYSVPAVRNKQGCSPSAGQCSKATV